METLSSTPSTIHVEQILLGHYTVGTSCEGADAYPHLLLFKCQHLRKWFRINSDIIRLFEELGMTINEGIDVDARLIQSATGLSATTKSTSFRKENNPSSIGR